MMPSILEELDYAVRCYKPLAFKCKYCGCKPIIVYNLEHLNFASFTNDIAIKILDTNNDCTYQNTVVQILSYDELIHCSDPATLIHLALEKLVYEWNDAQL